MDEKTDRLTDGRTENRTPISHLAEAGATKWLMHAYFEEFCFVSRYLVLSSHVKLSTFQGGTFVAVSFVLFIRPSKTGRIMSCPPSFRLPFRLSVIYFSCALHNSDTIQDIFMILGTNINHYQTICRE